MSGLELHGEGEPGSVLGEAPSAGEAAILNALAEPVYAVDGDWRFVFVNLACEAYLGIHRRQMLGRRLWDVLPAIIGTAVESHFRLVVSHRVAATFQGPSPSRPGRIVSLSATPAGEGMAVSFRDVTEAVRAAEAADARLEDWLHSELAGHKAAREHSEESLRAIFRASSEGLTFCELIRDETGAGVDYQVRDVNPAHALLTGATREQMLSRPVTRIAPPIDPRWIQTAADAVKTGRPQRFEVFSRPTRRWLDIRVSPVKGDFFAQTFIDVTARRALLEQRQMLLAEMNHRVKNNFQMVASLLQQQALRTQDAAAREPLQAAMRRVHVLAELHASLKPDEDPRLIDFAAYLRVLCDKLGRSIDEPDRIRFVLQADAADLPGDTAVSLGFVLNEVVTNALKHAFPGRTRGEIAVRLQRLPDALRLTIADNGGGFSGERSSDARAGTGTRLVDAFVAQVGGALEIHSDGGTAYVITVPWRTLPDP